MTDEGALSAVACFASIPVTSFRAPRAREYLETLPVPPPATVYGMLLSAIGQTDRLAHRGAELAIAILAPGTRVRVLRTLWRVKDRDTPLGTGENKRPDFQELLVDVRLAIHVRPGPIEARPTLADELRRAFRNPQSIQRFGGLSLGESTHLVDELRPLRPSDISDGQEAVWLVRDARGPYALPTWVDHVGAHGTLYSQFNLWETPDPLHPPGDEAWVAIVPPGEERV